MKKEQVKKSVNLNLRLNTVLQRLGLKNQVQIKDYLVGRSIIPINNSMGHQQEYPLNTPIPIDSMAMVQGTYSGYIYGMATSNGYGGSEAVYFSECVLAPDNKDTVENEISLLDARANEMNVQKGLLMEKIKYLEETKQKEVDGTEFKKYLIKKVLTGSATTNPDEKVSQIMELLAQ